MKNSLLERKWKGKDDITYRWICSCKSSSLATTSWCRLRSLWSSTSNAATFSFNWFMSASATRRHDARPGFEDESSSSSSSIISSSFLSKSCIGWHFHLRHCVKDCHKRESSNLINKSILLHQDGEMFPFCKQSMDQAGIQIMQDHFRSMFDSSLLTTDGESVESWSPFLWIVRRHLTLNVLHLEFEFRNRSICFDSHLASPKLPETFTYFLPSVVLQQGLNFLKLFLEILHLLIGFW